MAEYSIDISMETWLMDRKGMDALIEQHMDKARAAAFQEARRHRRMHEFDELVAAAYAGLVFAAQKYDPAMGTKFWTYAFKRVHWSILEELRGGTRVLRDKPGAVEDFADLMAVTVEEPWNHIDDLGWLVMRHFDWASTTTKLVIHAHFVEGLGWAEIASRIGSSRQAVQNRVTSAIKQLRKRYRARGAREKVL